MTAPEMCGVGVPARARGRAPRQDTYLPPEEAVLFAGVHDHMIDRVPGGTDVGEVMAAAQRGVNATTADGSLQRHRAAPAMLVAAAGLDRRAGDIWGVGCLLAEAVRGAPLFYRNGYLVQVRYGGGCALFKVRTHSLTTCVSGLCVQMLGIIGHPNPNDVPYLSRLSSDAVSGPLGDVVKLLLPQLHPDDHRHDARPAAADARRLRRHLPLLSAPGMVLQ